jgi:hypothetical protein
MSRHIYIYDPQSGQIVDDYEVTDQSDQHCELLKVRLLAGCKYPREVFDTADGHDPAFVLNPPRPNADISQSS